MKSYIGMISKGFLLNKSFSFLLWYMTVASKKFFIVNLTISLSLIPLVAISVTIAFSLLFLQ
ncbi:hypothetical protein [Methanobrevibacter cuticularis]|uniref:hypothetical protein n=1 Tax=Methanobrevibacter cuticularis TaxID=47311 RepID=UPI0012ED257B|nr:hypothetical protein [Methanobrevibacter cuticularis]